MPTVRFTSLTSNRTEDRFSPDEAALAFFRDSEYLGYIFQRLNENQVWDLNLELEFTDNLEIQLWEIDNPQMGDPHDFLGRVFVEANNTTGNGSFNRSGADYTLVWEEVAGQEPGQPAPPIMLRKDEANMTQLEQDNFIDAINTLIQNGRFGELVQDHAGPAGNMPYRNHGSMTGASLNFRRFLPWHRVYLYRLEREMRRIHPEIFIPYWNWRVNRRIPQWLRDFQPLVPMPANGPIQVTRTPRDARLLPRQNNVAVVRAQNNYFDFARELETGPHNFVHAWVGGAMNNLIAAPADPLFWLHHAEVDRIWSQWQVNNPGDNTGLTGNERIMDPWQESVPDVLDTEILGYRYS